jgi:6-phosphogluconolactonase
MFAHHVFVAESVEVCVSWVVLLNSPNGPWCAHLSRRRLRDGSVVVNVNAGSNSISAFAATAQGLSLIDTASSGGTDPTSVTISGDGRVYLVYVLNAGSNTIAGFRLNGGGLHPINGSVQPLGAGALVPKQIQFTNDGNVLVVDERNSNTIDAFLVGPNGKAGPAITAAATGGGPFGFDFDRAGHLLVSDAALTTGNSGATAAMRWMPAAGWQ